MNGQAQDRAQALLDRLWQRYLADVPYARVFLKLSGGSLVNDHVAFRTLRRTAAGKLPRTGIQGLAPLFERLGWRHAGSYVFPDVHLLAIHLSHPAGLPRIFISELLIEELSPAAQRILDALPPEAPPPASDDAAELSAWFDAPDRPLVLDELLLLAAESQYAAWMLAFGRKVNHFTAAVDNVEDWQRRLKEAGVPMKAEIEGEPGSLLRQTATHAAPLSVRLADGTLCSRPYAYLEIAERQPGFDGFLGKQARQLFDMTKR